MDLCCRGRGEKLGKLRRLLMKVESRLHLRPSGEQPERSRCQRQEGGGQSCTDTSISTQVLCCGSVWRVCCVCVEHFCASGGISFLCSLIQPCGVDSPNRPRTLSDDAWSEHPPLPAHQGRRSANAAHRDWAVPQHPSYLPAFPGMCVPSFQLLLSFFPTSVQREKKKAGSCNTRQKVPAVAGCAGRDGPVCSADLVLPLE